MKKREKKLGENGYYLKQIQKKYITLYFSESLFYI